MPAIGDRPHWPNSEALNCELAGDVERGFEAPEKCRKKRPPAPLTLTADMCGVHNKGQVRVDGSQQPRWHVETKKPFGLGKKKQRWRSYSDFALCPKPSGFTGYFNTKSEALCHVRRFCDKVNGVRPKRACAMPTCPPGSPAASSSSSSSITTCVPAHLLACQCTCLSLSMHLSTHARL